MVNYVWHQNNWVICLFINLITFFLFVQVFKTDEKNSIEIQTEVDALLERQRRDNNLSVPKTPSTR